jgi:glyoxylase-like metal-dependent hydrolase (beta-lactamase superfamily II)
MACLRFGGRGDGGDMGEDADSVEGRKALSADDLAKLPPAMFPRQLACWQDRVPPPTEAIAAGTWAIALPIHDSGLAYAYCYVLAVPDGFVLIDCGIAEASAQERLVSELATLGYRLEDIQLLICTHYHRDHFGNAAWLQEMTGVPVALHARDIAVLASLATGNRTEQITLWEDFGLGEVADVHALPDEGNPYLMSQAACPTMVLQDGQVINAGPRRLEVIWTPGHSPGHICLFERDSGILFVADQVLPRITSGIALLTSQRLDPLGDFLTSLDRLSSVQGVAIVATGHEYSFSDLAGRCADLRDHHQHRMAEITAALALKPGISAVALAAQIAWSRPWKKMTGRFGRMAISETMAHLVHLEQVGLVVRAGNRPVRWANAVDSLVLLAQHQGKATA